MTRIAILGGQGFLGAPMAAAFRSAGYEVVTFARNQIGASLDGNVKTDLFDIDSLRVALLDTRPNVVISTAWDTEHGKFWTSELNSKYKAATLEFAELSFELGVGAFLGLGTMSEYGSNPGECNAEISPVVAADIYSKAKIETGFELGKLGESFGRKTNWLRIFQAFGPNEKPERFIPGLISTLKEGKPFSIRTPNYEMDWIHTSDVASAVLFSLENQLSHFVDIGTGISTTVKNLSELVCSELGLNAKLLDFSNQVPGHEKKIVVDLSSQLFSAGWTPDESLEYRISSLR